MGLELPALVQRLTLDSSGFNAGLASAEGKTNSVMGSFAGLAKSGAAVAAPLLLIGGAAFKGAEDVDVAQKKIAASTGATGSTLKGLEQSWHNVASSSSASFNTIAESMSLVYQRTQLTGVPLETLTRQFLALGRVSRDGAPPIQLLTGVMTQFGVPAGQMSTHLDQLFRISQQTGVGMTQLTQTMQRVGPFAHAAGLDFAQTATFVAKLDQAGIPAQASAFALRTALKNAGEAGLSLRDYLGEAIPKIAELAKEGRLTDATFMASQVFGSRGAAIVAAIQNGKLSVDGLTQALGASGATVLETASKTKGFAQVMGEFKNKAELALAPLGEKLLPLVSGAFKFLGDHVDQIVPAMVVFGGAIAAIKLVDFVRNLQAAGSAILGALSSLTSMNPVILGLTAAIAVGVAVWHAFSGSNQNAKHAVENMTKAIEDQSGALDQNISKVLEASFSSKHQVDDLARLGISFTEVEKAITGSDKQFGALMRRVVDAEPFNLGLIANLQDQRKGFQDGAKGALDMAVANEVLSKKQTENLIATNTNKDGHVNWANVAETVREKEKQLADAHDKTKSATDGAAQAQDGLTTSTQDSEVATDAATQTTDGFNAALDATKSKAGDAGDKVKAFNDVLDALLDKTIGLTESEIKVNDAFDKTTEALAKSKGATDLLTQSGRDAASALDSQISAAYGHIKVMSEQGKSQDEINGFVSLYNLRLADQIGKTGLAAGAQQALIDKYHLTPEQVSTLVTLENGAANAAIDVTTGKMFALTATQWTASVGVDSTSAKTEILQLQAFWAAHSRWKADVIVPGGHRQFGGPVVAGGAYIVGEVGPEIFVPNVSGRIVPNVQGRTGSMVTVAPVFTINVDGTPDARTVNAMEAMLDRTVRDLTAQITAGVR